MTGGASEPGGFSSDPAIGWARLANLRIDRVSPRALVDASR